MKTDSSPRVLVFDSGVGGLSIAASVIQHLPGTELVYLADNAGFPYGDQPESVVIERCCRLIGESLAQYPCDVIIVACNTASTVVLPHLRAMTSTPVVGVVPAIKPAAAKTRNGRIGLLATPATVRRPYLDNLVDEFAGHCQVERIGHPDLVRWVEESVSGADVPRHELAEAVAGFHQAEVDTVVLGCTHYPLLLDALREVLPDVEFWVDSGEAIARRVAVLLEELGKAPDASRENPANSQPVRAALFSGPAPEGVAGFMEALGLAPRSVLADWPAQPRPVTTAASV
ncbi:glutamate racemase [Marinobacter sp. M216]|uniref:Glutamate racemase n=1 Tax=Marinobacter albus TaxID=3030833 RepID=A0ABT7HHG7_9GAMM|nr:MULTISPECIES: glutamate racemase [unclassified Marinobacter]MBW7472727.1 glutamate racemase [Marinobacter sp. F4218]MDK9559280.1 glutamate racemase [Marinobacter sp. M216]